MAIDTSPDKQLKHINSIIPVLEEFKNFLDGPVATKFGASGTAGGNEVIALRTKLIATSNSITDITSQYTAQQMEDSRLAYIGLSLPNFRADLLDIEAAIQTLLDLIDANTALFLAQSLQPMNPAIQYPPLGAGARSVVLSNTSAISALIA